MLMNAGNMKEQYREAFEKNDNYGPNPYTEITLLGDRNTRIQIVTLLSYIRHAIKNNMKKDITVSIGNNIANGEFDFNVNDTKADDLITKDRIEIN